MSSVLIETEITFLFYTRKASSVAMTMIENMTMMTIHTVNRSRL